MHTIQAFLQFDHLCDLYEIKRKPLLKIQPLKHNHCHTHFDSCGIPTIIVNETILEKHVPHSLASILIRELAGAVLPQDERGSIRYHTLCSLMFQRAGMDYSDQDQVNYHKTAGFSWLASIAGRWLLPRLASQASAQTGGLNSMLWAECDSLEEVAEHLTVPRDALCALLVPERLQELVVWTAAALCGLGAVSVALQSPLPVSLALLGTGLAVGCANHIASVLWIRATRFQAPGFLYL